MKKLLTSLWFQAAGISLLTLLVVGAISYPKKPVKSVDEPQAKKTLERSETPRQAIDNGQQFLLENFEKIQPGQRLILDYLHRKFAINNHFSATSNEIEFKVANQAVRQELEMIRHFAYPEARAEKLSPSPSLVARAANCDQVSMPEDISSTFEREISKGGYNLTHAALGLQLIEELGCKLDGWQKLREQVIKKMLAVVGGDSSTPDLRYECIAFLMYMGEYQAIKTDWINRIVADQQLDGSWLAEPTAVQGSDHATVLALWALLEYINPGVTEPIARRLD